ncbi:MAG: hypothetical protein WBF17_00730 [Phycisphaerae bacterium]
MKKQADNPEQPEPTEDLGELLWRFLDTGSSRWSTLDLSDATAAETSAVMRLLLSGQIQLRLRILARGLADEPKIEAMVVVTGDYTGMLAGRIRSAVPEFSGHVTVTPQLPAEYRLSTAGLATRQEVHEIGGGELDDGYLSGSLQFAIPGVVTIHELRYVEEEAPIPPDGTLPASPTDGKPRRAPAWPVAKTDGHVAAYLAARKETYLELARDVLDDRARANEEFQEKFGPTPIASEITEKVGTGIHRACRRQDVAKTLTYRKLLQPLMRKPPEKPVGWDELLEGRYGEPVSDLVDEIPFEDDDL